MIECSPRPGQLIQLILLPVDQSVGLYVWLTARQQPAHPAQWLNWPTAGWHCHCCCSRGLRRVWLLWLSVSIFYGPKEKKIISRFVFAAFSFSVSFSPICLHCVGVASLPHRRPPPKNSACLHLPLCSSCCCSTRTLVKYLWKACEMRRSCHSVAALLGCSALMQRWKLFVSVGQIRLSFRAPSARTGTPP